MRYVNAQVKIDPYTASFGAKGELQQAWFRVWDIPSDQRSIRTCAKVRGLVGKVLEIDEKTRLRHDYVRMKIACRDISKVPRTAESTLGLFLHDFYYEREVEVEGPERILNSGIKVTEGDQPPPSKKYKTDNNNGKGSLPNNGEQNSGKFASMGNDKGGGKQQTRNITMSAPPKIGSKNATGGKIVMQMHGGGGDDGERVHIPETFDESYSDSDMGDRIRRLEGFGDIGQGSSKTKDDEDAQQF